FAGSGFPAQVLRVDHGAVTDVTRRFPAVVKADARTHLGELRAAGRTDDVRGVLAAYVADQYLLGSGAKGTAEVDHQRRAGRVSAGFKKLLLRKLHGWKYR
ncbi:MAG: hypothetical protein QOK49_1514, partial [Baekduia sp.]|nr:hypothetical protein [Baekduia sp.]